MLQILLQIYIFYDHWRLGLYFQDGRDIKIVYKCQWHEKVNRPIEQYVEDLEAIDGG